MLERGEFLEHAGVHGYFYGTPRNWVEEELNAGMDVVLEIDVQGAVQVRRLFPQAILIFLAPPSWEELSRRLLRRLEHDRKLARNIGALQAEDEATIRRRLHNARQELARVDQYEYLIINDKLGDAINQFCAIVTAERCRPWRYDLTALLRGRSGGCLIPQRFTVVLGITGSIAAYKCADLVRKLRALRDPAHPERRVNVRAMLTEHGAQFITPVTLQTLTGNAVNQELVRLDARDWDVEHIGLADDADVLLIAPATANLLAKLAHGLADDLLSTTALACTAPLLIAPAMNVHMWEHPATQANVACLRERGALFIGPEVGELACGYAGRGRMSEVADIVRAVEQDIFSAVHRCRARMAPACDSRRAPMS